ncbi:MAG: hypothetical protein INH34_12570 [Phycisphaerales bacterium]|nr:hypothetical protein [Phycisphaerales bacterium]
MTMHESRRDLGFARGRRPERFALQASGKISDAACPGCGAVAAHGRWSWGRATAGMAVVVCPACVRIRERAAAHVLELTGDLGRCWNEVKGIIANVERAEVEDHPLERVMPFEVRDDRVFVPTTGLHVARRIAAAIVRRWRHGVQLRFTDPCTRIEWLPAGSRRG